MKAQDISAAREATAAKLAAALPEDRAALLAEAKQAAGKLHACILAADADGAAEASDRYDAIVWLLNGRTFFGCMAHAHSGSNVVAEHCRAKPGAVPDWSQRGEFLIAVNGIRCVVTHKEGFGYLHSSFGLHAVDLDRPFISETGYRSVFAHAVTGTTVEEAAIAIFEQVLAEKGRRPIKRENIASCERAKESWPWLDVVPASEADLSYEDRRGQMAFGF